MAPTTKKVKHFIFFFFGFERTIAWLQIIMKINFYIFFKKYSVGKEGHPHLSIPKILPSLTLHQIWVFFHFFLILMSKIENVIFFCLIELCIGHRRYNRKADISLFFLGNNQFSRQMLKFHYIFRKSAISFFFFFME